MRCWPIAQSFLKSLRGTHHIIYSVARELDGNGVQSGKIEELCRFVSVRKGEDEGNEVKGNVK